MTMSLGCCSVGNATACHAPQCLLTTVLPLNDYWCIWRLSRTWTHDQLHAKCSRITLIRHPGVTEITFSLILSTSLKMFRMEGTGTRWSRLVANHSWISTTSYFWYGSDVIHRSTIILWRYNLEIDTAFNSIRLLRSWALSMLGLFSDLTVDESKCLFWTWFDYTFEWGWMTELIFVNDRN